MCKKNVFFFSRHLCKRVSHTCPSYEVMQKYLAAQEHSDAKSQFLFKDSNSQKVDLELKIAQKLQIVDFRNFESMNNFDCFVSL